MNIKKESKFNPQLKEFLAKKKNITVLGLFWAGYWRLMIVVFGAYFVVLLFGIIFS